MTSEQIPLGQKEGQRLEFKSREVLNKRFQIGRKVVGMLNAVGGEAWIGIAEEEGRAHHVESIEDAETERRALRDYLVDSIEPPISSEVVVEIVSTSEGEEVLRLRVRPDEARKPYALLRKTLRDFVIRVDERLRPMGRDEILRQPKKTQDALDQAIDRVQKARDQVERFPNGTFWLHFEPVGKLSIEVQDPVFQDLVMDPSLTNNRATGWHFARAHESPQLGQSRINWAWGYPKDRKFEVVTKRSGTLTFRASLEAFRWRQDGRWEENQFGPFILVEYPTSAFRLANFIYGMAEGTSRQVLVECAFLDIADWGLQAGDPERGPRKVLQHYTDAQDLIWEKPLDFTMDEIRDEPDRCGFRLVRRIYEAFSLPEDAIPFFDRKSGRLVLPE